jgi:hypothetical protein
MNGSRPNLGERTSLISAIQSVLEEEQDVLKVKM